MRPLAPSPWASCPQPFLVADGDIAAPAKFRIPGLMPHLGEYHPAPRAFRALCSLEDCRGPADIGKSECVNGPLAIPDVGRRSDCNLSQIDCFEQGAVCRRSQEQNGSGFEARPD